MATDDRKTLIRVLVVIVIVFILLVGYFYNKSRTNERASQTLDQRMRAGMTQQQRVDSIFQDAVGKAAADANPLKVGNPLAEIKIDLTKKARAALNPF